MFMRTLGAVTECVSLVDSDEEGEKTAVARPVHAPCAPAQTEATPGSTEAVPGALNSLLASYGDITDSEEEEGEIKGEHSHINTCTFVKYVECKYM